MTGIAEERYGPDWTAALERLATALATVEQPAAAPTDQWLEDTG